jgi:hypothetical protein
MLNKLMPVVVMVLVVACLAGALFLLTQRVRVAERERDEALRAQEEAVQAGERALKQPERELKAKK